MRRNVTRTGTSRKPRHHRYLIRTWVDRLIDVPAFVIGNGPSVNDHNLLLLEDYLSIGINRIWLALDPTILLWQDISLWNTEYHRLHNLQALKIARDSADPKRIYYNYYLKAGQFAFEKKTHVLFGHGNTAILGVELAYAMGCNPIVLIGMDCKVGKDGRTDFYGNNVYWNPESTLLNCQRALQFIKDKCPATIINCSHNDLWERRDLIDVLENDIAPSFARGRKAYVAQLLALADFDLKS